MIGAASISHQMVRTLSLSILLFVFGLAVDCMSCSLKKMVMKLLILKAWMAGNCKYMGAIGESTVLF